MIDDSDDGRARARSRGGVLIHRRRGSGEIASAQDNDANDDADAHAWIEHIGRGIPAINLRDLLFAASRVLDEIDAPPTAWEALADHIDMIRHHADPRLALSWLVAFGALASGDRTGADRDLGAFIRASDSALRRGRVEVGVHRSVSDPASDTHEPLPPRPRLIRRGDRAGSRGRSRSRGR